MGEKLAKQEKGTDQTTLERCVELLERLSKRVDDIDARLRQQAQLTPAVIRALLVSGMPLPPPYDLAVGRFGMYSQNEEDGLILSIFRRAGVANRRFVEIGCGVKGGNSGFLARELGWSGLMIDARRGAVEKIRIKFSGHDVRAEKQRVTRESVNAFLESTGFAGEIDFLSIDIDGNDYWVWEAITACSPRVVGIEYNWLFGPSRAVTVPYDPLFVLDEAPTRSYRGASIAALVHLGRRKGYRLVVGERVNAFFVRHDVAPDIIEIPAERAYRHPGNVGLDPFEKIARLGLTLVEVGDPIPAGLPAAEGDESS